jgi:hypothetical protein
LQCAQLELAGKVKANLYPLFHGFRAFKVVRKLLEEIFSRAGLLLLRAHSKHREKKQELLTHRLGVIIAGVLFKLYALVRYKRPLKD